METAHYRKISLTAEEADMTYPWQFRSPVDTGASRPLVYADAVQLLGLESTPQTFYDTWIQPVTMAAGTHPKQCGSSTGYYDRGRHFGGILYSSTFRDGTDAIWNLNYSTYYSALANPASCLYTVDCRGRTETQSAWAGSVCSSTALRACGYLYPYSSSAIKAAFREKADHGIDSLEFGDILWRAGHVAGVIGVVKGADGRTERVRIIEQACYVMIFEITAAHWPLYFSGMWTGIYRSEAHMRKAPEELVAYPENLSIIFERGNNTYVTDFSRMLFYIPTADTVYLTRDGKTTPYATASFPTRTVNGTAVYDLASLFTGVGDYYFHTNENPTDVCIKVIGTGTITVDPEAGTATLTGYRNCTPHGYCIARITEKPANGYDFLDAPNGYMSTPATLTYRRLDGDTFVIENIPENIPGWKLEIYYDTGYGWARALSENFMY